MSDQIKFNRRDFLLSCSAFGVTIAANQLRLGSANAVDPNSLIAQARVSLTGAGASFPAPIYTRWFSEYNRSNPNVQINYQSIGSGAGVQQFIAGTVDFGASDVAMTDEEIAKVSRGVVLLPMTAGSIVVAYNLPGVNSLKLSRDALVGIFLGTIKTWNDPKIAQNNAGVKLPSTPISVVYRADGSGTTGVFTKHLSAISPQWRGSPGEGKSVSWPVGVGAKGNEGVTAQIKQTPGAIGYIEYSYAQSNNIPTAALQNKAGNYVPPTPQNSASALASLQLPANLRGFVSDPAGGNSYPIVSYSWIMAYRTYPDANKSQALKQVLNWALGQGQQVAPQLGYIPLPSSVVARVKTAINSIK